MLVEIYGKEGCSFCEKALTFAKTKSNFSIEYVDLTKGDASVSDLVERVGVPIKSVPQIFVDGEYIGGFTEFYDKFKGPN